MNKFDPGVNAGRDGAPAHVADVERQSSDRSKRLESLTLKALVPRADAREGAASFREKRSPQFALKPSVDMPEFYPWWQQPEFDEGAHD